MFGLRLLHGNGRGSWGIWLDADLVSFNLQGQAGAGASSRIANRVRLRRPVAREPSSAGRPVPEDSTALGGRPSRSSPSIDRQGTTDGDRIGWRRKNTATGSSTWVRSGPEEE
jgi:hypothetical protein